VDFWFLTANPKSEFIMTKALLILCTLGIISCNVKNDTLAFTDLNLNGIYLGQTSNSIMKKMGNPDSISNYESETDNEIWKDYQYKGNSIYLFENKWVNFKLQNGNFYFYKPEIKVGNRIETIQSFFPNSYRNKEILNGLGFVIIDIIDEKDENTDSFVVLNYDATTNQITSIHLGSK
jgi:hypothetical protein